MFDTVAARDWQRAVSGEADCDYAEAVGWCLEGNQCTPQNLGREDMLGKVMQLLKEC